MVSSNKCYFSAGNFEGVAINSNASCNCPVSSLFSFTRLSCTSVIFLLTRLALAYFLQNS